MIRTSVAAVAGRLGTDSRPPVYDALMNNAPTMFDRPDRSVLVTSGSGASTTPPDFAVVSFDARIVRESPTDALAAVTEVANRVVSALDELGVSAASVLTSPGHVDRERSWDQGREQIIGWFAAYSVRARITDPSVVFTSILRISEIEAVTIGAPMWQIDRNNPAWERARIAAVDDARARATQLARAAGLELGPIVELREGGPSFSPMVSVRSAMTTESVTPPAHGLESVETSVTITFSVSPR